MGVWSWSIRAGECALKRSAILTSGIRTEMVISYHLQLFKGLEIAFTRANRFSILSNYILSWPDEVSHKWRIIARASSRRRGSAKCGLRLNKTNERSNLARW